MSNPPLEPLIVVETTVGQQQDADRLAAEMLRARLVACVQVEGPITSHYRWSDELKCEQEYRLVMKSRANAWPMLHELLASQHPYDEPEILMRKVDESSVGYRRWVLDQTD